MNLGFAKTKPEWKEKFNQYDRNKDGVIECWELKRFLQVMGLNPTDQNVIEVLKEDFNKTEKDVIVFEEFYEWIRKQPDPMGELYDAFQCLDKDKSGFLELEEFRKVMSCVSDDDELRELFEFVDVDSDGKIEYKEFVNMFCEQDDDEEQQKRTKN